MKRRLRLRRRVAMCVRLPRVQLEPLRSSMRCCNRAISDKRGRHGVSQGRACLLMCRHMMPSSACISWLVCKLCTPVPQPTTATDFWRLTPTSPVSLRAPPQGHTYASCSISWDVWLCVYTSKEVSRRDLGFSDDSRKDHAVVSFAMPTVLSITTAAR